MTVIQPADVKKREPPATGWCEDRNGGQIDTIGNQFQLCPKNRGFHQIDITTFPNTDHLADILVDQSAFKIVERGAVDRCYCRDPAQSAHQGPQKNRIPLVRMDEIDLFLPDKPEKVNQMKYYPVIRKSDHPMLHIRVKPLYLASFFRHQPNPMTLICQRVGQLAYMILSASKLKVFYKQ